MIKDMKYMTNLLKSQYSSEEKLISSCTALAYSIFIYIPIVMMTVQLFYCLISMPYVMVTLCLLLLILFVYILMKFKMKLLKKAKYVEEINYNKYIYYTILFLLPLFIATYVFVIIYVVPKFII